MRYQLPVHHRDDAYLREVIREKFSTSLMSDSKWVKLLDALVANVAEVKLCLVKPIWEETAPHRQLWIDEPTRYNFDYYATAMEAMVSGKPRGWYAYKEIEWLDFPRIVNATGATQDLEAIKHILDSAGQFALNSTPDNLRLYAYYS